MVHLYLDNYLCIQQADLLWNCWVCIQGLLPLPCHPNSDFCNKERTGPCSCTCPSSFGWPPCWCSHQSCYSALFYRSGRGCHRMIEVGEKGCRSPRQQIKPIENNCIRPMGPCVSPRVYQNKSLFFTFPSASHSHLSFGLSVLDYFFYFWKKNLC